ncbi:MAG: hypothetical protein ACREXP_19515, partial [Steroidobacteraceae bacterium]
MATVSNVGGRASYSDFQLNHTIPRQLFEGANRPELIKLLQRLPGIANGLNLDGPENLQPLPDDLIPDGSAIHNGSHPGMTRAVRQTLDDAWEPFYQANRADIDAVVAQTADPATQARVRTAVEAELRGQIEDFQFKSTNFMDAETVGNRVIFNSRDFAYLQQTETWAQATPQERAAALRGDSKVRTALIERHNLAVAAEPLSPARALEQKVLRDLGDGALAHLDGSPEPRNAIRALIADAQAHGVDLNAIDAKLYMKAVEDRLDLNPALQGLNNQIDSLTAQINALPPSQQGALIVQRAQLVSERALLHEAEVVGAGQVQAPANFLRRTVAAALTSRAGRAASTLALDLGKKLIAKGIPVVNVLDTASDIYDVIAFANEMGLRHSPTYRGHANDLYQFLTGRDLDLAAYARYDDGGEAIAIHDLDGGVIVTAVRDRPSGPWAYVVTAVEAFGNVLASTAGFLGAILRLTGGESRRTYSAEVMQRRPDGSWEHAAVDENPTGTDLSVRQETRTNLDGAGNETGSSSSVGAVKRDADGTERARYELTFE